MTKQRVVVNQERVRELYDYDPETGLLISKTFGISVGGMHNKYLCIELWDNGKLKRFFSHRLIWLYVHGKWPDNQIDHINGIKTDNRIANLRDVTHQENQQNKPIFKTKFGKMRSGYKGVHWTGKKWIATIGHEGKTIYLGTFTVAEHAYAAYVAKANELHTHNEIAKMGVIEMQNSWQMGGDRFLRVL